MTPRALAIASALAGLLLAPTLWARAGDAVATLDRARRNTGRLAAETTAPPTPMVPLLAGGHPIASDPALAQQALTDRLRLAAARGGVLVEQITREKQAGPIAAATIVVTGSEAGVMAFARVIEADDAIVRFSSWHLDRSGDGGPLRLEARAVALRSGA